MADGKERPVRERLISLVARILGLSAAPGVIPVDAPLSEIGMSSLKMVNLMLGVEAEFDINIPQSQITPDNFRSITSIEALVRSLADVPAAQLI